MTKTKKNIVIICTVFAGVVLFAVIMMFFIHRDFGRTIRPGTVITIHIPPLSRPTLSGISESVTIPLSNLKDQIPVVFSSESEKIDGIVLLRCYHFKIRSPFGEKNLKTYQRMQSIPISQFLDDIHRDNGLTIERDSEEFDFFSQHGNDLNIVPNHSDCPAIRIENMDYFSTLLVTTTLYYGTYRAENEISTALNANPLPEWYEKHFVYSIFNKIDLNTFSLR